MVDMVGNELHFYAKFTKPLILNLPDPNDRVLAAGWVKKILSDEGSSEKLRTDYIKLLLFALQRRKLVGIFSDDAANYDKLETFPSEFDLNEMARELIEKEQKERQNRIRTQLIGQVGDFPPYTTDWSADYKEFVAAQDIPGFGVHCYYAISKEPINLWKQVGKTVFPKVAKSAVDTTSPLPKPGGDACVCPEETEDSECLAKRREDVRRKSKKLGQSPPLHPIGKVIPPETEERQPPTWGSNLTEIKPSPRKEEDEDEPKPKYTGAIPKVKGQAVKIIYEDSATIDEIEQALKDFRTGEISGIHRKQKSLTSEQLTADSELQTEFQGSPFQDVAGALISPEALEAWESIQLDTSAREEEVLEDSVILENFKKQLAQSQTRQTISEERNKVQATLPAKAGLPVTTPRLSPSPRRIESAEKIYMEDLEPPRERMDLKRKATPGKDKKMVKMYERVSFAVADDEDKEKEEYLKQQLEEEERIKGADAKAREEEALRRKQEEEEKRKKAAELKKSVKVKQIHIQRSSPEANAIIADFMDTYKTTTQTEEKEETDDTLYQTALDQTAMNQMYFSVQEESCSCAPESRSPARTVQEREVTIVTERPQGLNVFTVQPAASEMLGSVPMENVYDVEEAGTEEPFSELYEGIEDIDLADTSVPDDEAFEGLPFCKRPPRIMPPLSPQERKYIDFTLQGDIRQRDFFKRIASMVSDVPTLEEESEAPAEFQSPPPPERGIDEESPILLASPVAKQVDARPSQQDAGIDAKSSAAKAPSDAGPPAAKSRLPCPSTCGAAGKAPGKSLKATKSTSLSRIPAPGAAKGAAARSQIPGPPKQTTVGTTASKIGRPATCTSRVPKSTQIPKGRQLGIPRSTSVDKPPSPPPSRGTPPGPIYPEIIVTEPTPEEICACDPGTLERFQQMALFTTSPPTGFDDPEILIREHDVIPLDLEDPERRVQQISRRGRRHRDQVDTSFEEMRQEMSILPPRPPPSPEMPYFETPKRIICQKPTGPGQKVSRITKDTVKRRIDFGQEEEDPRFAHLPPLPPGTPPTPPQLIDAPLPFGLPDPVQPPPVVHGYSTPEHLQIRRPPPMNLRPTSSMFASEQVPPTSWVPPQYSVDVSHTTPPQQYVTCQSYQTPEGSPWSTPEAHIPSPFGEEGFLTPGKTAEEIFQTPPSRAYPPPSQSPARPPPQYSSDSSPGGIEFMLSQVELSQGREGIVRRPHIMAKTQYYPEMQGIREQPAHDTYQQFQYQYPWERIQMQPTQLDFSQEGQAPCEPCRVRVPDVPDEDDYMSSAAGAYQRAQQPSYRQQQSQNKPKARKIPRCQGPCRKKK